MRTATGNTTVAKSASDDIVDGAEASPPAVVRWIGMVAGPIAAIIVWLVIDQREPAAAATADAAVSLSREGAIVLSLIVWMAVWWLTQAVELSTTALLPLLILPITGVTQTFAEAAAPFASDVIFLFAGGCLLAMALERHGISRRVAMAMLNRAGARPALIVGGFMLSSAIISAFVSNTATAAMMLPMGVAAAVQAEATAPEQPDRALRIRLFGVAVLLAIAYGASIGGALTLIGSPPNAIAAQLMRGAGGDLTFLGWLKFSAPTVAVFLPIAWWLLAVVMIPVRRLDLHAAPRVMAPTESALPPISRAGWFTLAVFAVVVTLWVSMPWLPAQLRVLRDAGVAVLAGAALLLVPLARDPGSTALSWSDAARLPWGVFVLFGGGLSVAAAIERHGVALWLSRAFHDLAGSPEIVVLAVVVVAVLFMTEIASNTAIAATSIPVLLALAPALGMPVERLVIPAAFAASWAFMLPVGTPPNALVFSTGRIPAMTMARVGFVLNLAAVVVITLAAWLLL